MRNARAMDGSWGTVLYNSVDYDNGEVTGVMEGHWLTPMRVNLVLSI